MGALSVFFAIWQFASDAHTDPAVVYALVGVPCSLLIGWILIARLRHRRARAKIDAAIVAYEHGEMSAARQILGEAPRSGWLAAYAQHYLAAIALTEGDAEQALEAATSGIRALTVVHRGTLPRPIAAKSGEAPPWTYERALAGQRAHALAALGRIDEARAEIAWANGFPGPGTAFLVELEGALASGDFEAAATLVESAPRALVPSADEEVLFDLVRYVARPEARDIDAGWILRELAKSPRLRRRTEAFAPGLIARFEQRRAAAERAHEEPEEVAGR
jgi:hypothetical protein